MTPRCWVPGSADVVLRGAKVGGQLAMVGAKVTGTLDMSSATIGGHLINVRK